MNAKKPLSTHDSNGELHLSTTVILACQHQLEFVTNVPNKDDEIWCKTCQKYSAVFYVPARKDLRKVKCRDCRYSRSFGTARLTAERAMVRHSQQRPRHRVQLLDGSGKLLHEASVNNDVRTVELPFDAAPPF